MKSCPVCGAQLHDSDIFCNSCGARCETPVSASQSAAQAVLQAEPPAAPGYVRPERESGQSRQEYDPQQGYAQSYAPPPQQAPYAACAPESDPNGPLTTWGYALALFLMGLPLVGFVLQIIWAAGGTRSVSRRNLARGYLVLRCFLAALVLLIVVVVLAAALPLLRRIGNGFDYFYDFFRYIR